MIQVKNFTKADYTRLCNMVWYAPRSPYMVSQVTRYFRNGKPEPALLLYSMSPHVTFQHCLKLLQMLEQDCRNIVETQINATENADNLFVPK